MPGPKPGQVFPPAAPATQAFPELKSEGFSRWLKRRYLMEYLVLLLIVVVWYLLQAVILPKLGVPT
jgi:hypothetical protein